MDIKLILEFLVILGALYMGARAGGVGLGLWGAVGLLVQGLTADRVLLVVGPSSRRADASHRIELIRRRVSAP
jgi:hypothetical protein